ncbi:hypothetical protein TGMAS_311905 [Toxoplasma gondii MAS]|uniref:Uncharacterized protein n=1 Tax=Toxoplasma gondii MAS TaxID=943118 RepID=A0A086QZC6_TOXGO|nr:hypothetical protein TGMAS_311905 [Toxoplasma gondii MAS]
MSVPPFTPPNAEGALLRGLHAPARERRKPSSSASSSTPQKPVRTAFENGRFLCYKCKANWAVCDDREKSCRNCLLNLVRSTVVSHLRKVAETSRQLEEAAKEEGQRETTAACGSGREETETARAHRRRPTTDEADDQKRVWFVAVSGGPASLALVHILRDHLLEQRSKWERRKAGQLRRQTHADRHRQAPAKEASPDAPSSSSSQDGPETQKESSSSSSPLSSSSARQDCPPLPLFAVHVDVAPWLPRGPASSQGCLEKSSESSLVAELRAILDSLGVPLLVIPPTAAFFHNSSSGPSSSGDCSSDSVSCEDGGEALRVHLQAVLAEDGNAFEALLRVIIVRSLFHFLQRPPLPLQADNRPSVLAARNAAADFAGESKCRDKERSEQERPTQSSSRRSLALLCFGDSSTRLAVRLLLKACQGDGLTLQQEAQLVDDRFLPSFCLCRPLLSISAKEAAMYCRYAALPFLSTNPYSLVLPFPAPSLPLPPLPSRSSNTVANSPASSSSSTSSSSSSSSASSSSSSPSSLSSPAFVSVRSVPLSFLIRSFLLDLQRNFPSTVSNVLKTSQKAVPVSRRLSTLVSSSEENSSSLSQREGGSDAKNDSSETCSLCLLGLCDPETFSDNALWDSNQRRVGRQRGGTSLKEGLRLRYLRRETPGRALASHTKFLRLHFLSSRPPRLQRRAEMPSTRAFNRHRQTEPRELNCF